MHIVAALFVDRFTLDTQSGPSARIDLTGVHFSRPAPSPAPVTVTPEFVALIYCPPDESGQGVFEVVFRRGHGDDAEEIARNVSPFMVEPGRFSSRTVHATLDFPDYGQVIAHCRVDQGAWLQVPYTLLPPVS